MDQLKEAILKTIKYGRNFGAEYGAKEIKERLISGKKYPDREVAAKLREMKWPKNKRDDQQILINKVDKSQKLTDNLAKRFPDILMIGITGSVAAGYPKENEDIDLMIITKKDSLWINRLEMKIWTWKNKIPRRKYGVKQKKDDFCFNLWLEEGSLRMPKNRQNLKNAMDLILMKPIVNKNKIYERFIKENGWAKKYVANGYNRKNPPGPAAAGPPSLDKEGKTHFGMGRTINWIAFKLQYVYMKRKLTAETVDPKRAFFHPKSRRGRILL